MAFSSQFRMEAYPSGDLSGVPLSGPSSVSVISDVALRFNFIEGTWYLLRLRRLMGKVIL